MDVRIYVNQKSVMQSGRNRVGSVVLVPLVKGRRWIEPLMGRTSVSGTLGQIKLIFGTVDAAVDYAKSKGWGYVIDPIQTRRVHPRNYTDAFKYIPPVGDRVFTGSSA